MKQTSTLFRLLGHSTRLRLLRVLMQDRFNVTELTGILDLAQSGVSRHLGLLKDAGLVVEEPEAGYVYYGLAENDHNGNATLWPLLKAELATVNKDRSTRADDARLQEVLRIRQENFETHGDEKQLVPGRSWAAWARILGHLLPPLDVVDIGCGEGYLALEASRWAKTVIGIDRSDEVLRRARALMTRRNVSNILWKKGDLAQLPLPNESVDVALLSQALHHTHNPGQALQEAYRVLRPTGRVLILDLREHEETWVRDRFGDTQMGFSNRSLEKLLRSSGYSKVKVGIGAKRTGDPFTVLIASGVRPGNSSVRHKRNRSSKLSSSKGASHRERH